MPALKITPRAESDLVGIWLYSKETWGAEQADKYLDQLAAGMHALVAHPELGIDYSHVRPGYRRFRIEHHDIYYQILESELRIVRVLHESMDAPQQLADQ